MPTTIDNHTLIFAFIVLFVSFMVGMLTRRSSIRESMQRQRDQLSITAGDGDPAHFWIDTSASFGAKVVCALWIAVGVYLAIAIMLGNLLWLPVFLGH